MEAHQTLLCLLPVSQSEVATMRMDCSYLSLFAAGGDYQQRLCIRSQTLQATATACMWHDATDSDLHAHLTSAVLGGLSFAQMSAGNNHICGILSTPTGELARGLPLCCRIMLNSCLVCLLAEAITDCTHVSTLVCSVCYMW